MNNKDLEITKADIAKLEILAKYYKLSADIEEHRYRMHYYRLKYFEFINGLQEIQKKEQDKENTQEEKQDNKSMNDNAKQ